MAPVSIPSGPNHACNFKRGLCIALTQPSIYRHSHTQTYNRAYVCKALAQQTIVFVLTFKYTNTHTYTHIHEYIDLTHGYEGTNRDSTKRATATGTGWMYDKEHVPPH